MLKMNKFDWSLLLFFMPLAMMIVIGCDSSQASAPVTNPALEASRISIQDLGRNGGKWRVIELIYKNKTYILIQNYDGDNQSLVKIDEFLTEQ